MSSGYIQTADRMAPTSGTGTAEMTSVPPMAQYPMDHSAMGQANMHYPMPMYGGAQPFFQQPSINPNAFVNDFPTPAQEILKRATESANVSADSPAWHAMREQVMKNMVVSSNHSPPTTSSPSTRGRGRGRGGGVSQARLASQTQPSAIASIDLVVPTNGTSATTDATQAPVKRGRGRPRGSGAKRGRGTARPAGLGRKRKRNADDEEISLSEDEDDEKSDFDAPSTPLPTITKSGRSITKPTQYNPVAEIQSPDGSNKRRRSYRRGPEFQLCAKCQRGHSPTNNVIVFCDGCNDAYHQWCHDPQIAQDVIDVAEKEWFCGKCLHKREMANLPLDKRVSGVGMSIDERRTYLSSLPNPTLVSLLMRATEIHPTLPMFPPLGLLNKTSSAQPLQQSRESVNGTMRSIPSTIVKSQDQLSPEQDPRALDPYPEYSNLDGDPPATYSMPGRGPIKIRPLTDPVDMPWMLDENSEVYSHLVDDGSGNLMPVQAHRDGSWTERHDKPKIETNTDHSHAVQTAQAAAGGLEEVKRNGISDEADADGDSDEIDDDLGIMDESSDLNMDLDAEGEEEDQGLFGQHI